MAGYVNVDEVKKAIEESWDGCLGAYGCYEIILNDLWVIDKVPTADVVEVVRCKDCKYWKTVGACVAKFCTCIVNTEVMKDEDDYCSLGERRGNED